VAPDLPATGPGWFTGGMALPYKVSTLLYCFNDDDDVLLLERLLEPNRGRWSPPGGKVRTDDGESPYAGAAREAAEELGLHLHPADFRLTGLVSEHGYEGQAHWLMFLFEAKPRLPRRPPPPMREGRLAFFPKAALADISLPDTDRELIWPMFWRHRGGFFAAHCHIHPDATRQWSVQQSTLPLVAAGQRVG